MLSRLYLLRHAKAVSAAPGMADFDRPLDRRGLADARAVGEAMASGGHRPALVLCSAARRAQETWAGVEAVLGPAAGEVRFLRALYGTDARGYIDAVRSVGDETDTVLLVGHNPTIEETACLLAQDGAERFGTGFPTSGLAVFRFDGALSAVRPGAGVLEAFFAHGR